MKDSEGKPRYYRGRGGSGRGRLRKIASHGKLVDRYARTARNCTCGPGRFARWNVDSIPDHHRVHFHCCRGHNSELLLPLPSRFRLDPVFSDLPLPLSLHRSRYSCTSVTTYRSPISDSFRSHPFPEFLTTDQTDSTNQRFVFRNLFCVFPREQRKFVPHALQDSRFRLKKMK